MVSKRIIKIKQMHPKNICLGLLLKQCFWWQVTQIMYLFSNEQTCLKYNNKCIWNKNKFWYLVESFVESKRQTFISFNHQYYFVNMQTENSKNVQSRKIFFHQFRPFKIECSPYCTLLQFQYFKDILPYRANLYFLVSIFLILEFFQSKLSGSFFATNLFSVEIPGPFIVKPYLVVS